jgi:hypothetical protein
MNKELNKVLVPASPFTGLFPGVKLGAAEPTLAARPLRLQDACQRANTPAREC